VTSLVVGWSLVVTRVHCGQTVHPRPIVTTPGIQWYNFRPPGVTPNRGMGPPWGAFCQITLTSCFQCSVWLTHQLLKCWLLGWFRAKSTMAHSTEFFSVTVDFTRFIYHIISNKLFVYIVCLLFLLYRTGSLTASWWTDGMALCRQILSKKFQVSVLISSLWHVSYSPDNTQLTTASVAAAVLVK